MQPLMTLLYLVHYEVFEVVKQDIDMNKTRLRHEQNYLRPFKTNEILLHHGIFNRNCHCKPLNYYYSEYKQTNKIGA
jgi:hypothetical protein